MKRSLAIAAVFVLLGLGCRRSPSGTAAPAARAPQAARAAAHDWPQWRGKWRAGVTDEKGLLQEWPPQGPALAWQTSRLGGGYSAPSVAAGRIYGMSYHGGSEGVWALDEQTGREVWWAEIAAANTRVGYPEGSRCTPTVDGDRVYALGVSGDLVCLSAGDGRVVWQKSLARDFGGKVPPWGYSESPLVDGDRVVATPGGRAATLVALNKQTGAPVWQGQVPEGDEAQYSSCVVANIDGVRQYVQFLKGGVVGIAAANGAFLWRYDSPANKSANCTTPVWYDRYVFAASGYNTGGGLARIAKAGGGFAAQEVYFSRSMKNHHGGVVLAAGCLYGADDPASLTCLDLRTGQVRWQERRAGKGSIAYADGRLYYRTENGTVSLVEASPTGYAERGRFQQPQRSGKSAWPHPVIANGKLYLRDQDTLLCYNVKQ